MKNLYICSVKNLNFHIAFLLTKHECVIIPGFGAFIVSDNNKKRADGRNVLPPPESFLSFNSEITHNDGLLANSVAREKNCGFSEAMTYIQSYSDDLHTKLIAGETVQLPWVGRLAISKEGKIIFTAAPNQSCNADFYGFTGVRLPRLIELEKQNINTQFRSKKRSDVIWIPISRKIALYAASTAAAVMAMLLWPMSLNDYSREIQPQEASFWMFPAKETAKEIRNCEEFKEISAEKKVDEAKPADSFFIVIASLASREIAEAELPRFIAKGFDKASVFSSQGKHRIVVASFADRQEAVKYLQQFRKDNPKYAKAWLFTEKK
jgi:nucleoid DNA-binding protein